MLHAGIYTVLVTNNYGFNNSITVAKLWCKFSFVMCTLYTHTNKHTHTYTHTHVHAHTLTHTDRLPFMYAHRSPILSSGCMENSAWKWPAKWGVAGIKDHVNDVWMLGGGSEYDKLESSENLIWHSLVYVVFLVNTIPPSVHPQFT